MTRTMSHTRLRLLMLAFALVLGFQGMWIILPETIRPGPIHLSFDAQAAALAKPQRTKAAWAASLGSVRGELWADNALTYADLIWTGNTNNKDASDRLEQEARASAERALTYSPHRADVWLLLAAFASRFDGTALQAASALKLSFYTGSNEIYLIPLRLFVTFRSQALDDVELQEMVRRDIRIAITRKPDMKPALIIAYKNASPENRSFVEQAIAEVDATFLASVRDGIR
jgi:hypothetical protein